MNKWILLIILIIVVGGGALLFGDDNNETAQVTPPPASPTPTPLPTPSPEPTPTPNPVSAKVVTYTDAGYSPKTIEIAVGETVTFKNNSTEGMWTASNPHPSHTTYSAFDAKREMTLGESYSFTFTQVGTWRYHNHVNPGHTGTVIVK